MQSFAVPAPATDCCRASGHFREVLGTHTILIATSHSQNIRLQRRQHQQAGPRTSPVSVDTLASHLPQCLRRTQDPATDST